MLQTFPKGNGSVKRRRKRLDFFGNRVLQSRMNVLKEGDDEKKKGKNFEINFIWYLNYISNYFEYQEFCSVSSKGINMCH